MDEIHWLRLLNWEEEELERFGNRLQELHRQTLDNERGEQMREGQRVRLDPTHEQYEDFRSQSHGSDGEIIAIPVSSSPGRSELWTRVRWDNGHRNAYPLSALVMIHSADSVGWGEVERQPNDPVRRQREEGSQSRADTLHDVPMLPGVRFCLNPDARNYRQIKSEMNDDAGYVIDTINLTSSALMRWDELDKNDVIVIVQFDNGHRFQLKHSEILPIDRASVDITKYIFETGLHYYYGMNEKDANMLDRHVIIDGCKILDAIKYDNTYRQGIYDGIANRRQEN